MNATVVRWATRGAIGLVASLVAIQLVPFGRDHTNPPVTAEPSWDSPRTRELAKRACFDCHSNETVYPVYASVAPFSWLVADHVEEGRGKLNFSEFDRPQREAHEAGEVVSEGEMPPGYYTLLHPSARLSDAELRELANGLVATLGGEEGELARGHGRGGGFPTAGEEGEEDDD
ncbi:MAG: heme-binding domain-containing protein [Myxococcales bacterium]|nr:heme-binding domain-containing protein [Myxococcales bacterium]